MSLVRISYAPFGGLEMPDDRCTYINVCVCVCLCRLWFYRVCSRMRLVVCSVFWQNTSCWRSSVFFVRVCLQCVRVIGSLFDLRLIFVSWWFDNYYYNSYDTMICDYNLNDGVRFQRTLDKLIQCICTLPQIPYQSSQHHQYASRVFDCSSSACFACTKSCSKLYKSCTI